MKEMHAWGYKLLMQAASAAGHAAKSAGRPAEGGGQRQGSGPQGASRAIGPKAEGASVISKSTACIVVSQRRGPGRAIMLYTSSRND
jgi:hypothetical protein